MRGSWSGAVAGATALALIVLLPGMAAHARPTAGPLAPNREERLLVAAEHERRQLLERELRRASSAGSSAANELAALDVVPDGPTAPGRTVRVLIRVRAAVDLEEATLSLAVPRDVTGENLGYWKGPIPAGQWEHEVVFVVPVDGYRRDVTIELRVDSDGEGLGRLPFALERTLTLNAGGRPHVVSGRRGCDSPWSGAELSASGPLRPGATVDVVLRSDLLRAGDTAELLLSFPHETVLLKGATYRPRTVGPGVVELRARVRLPRDVARPDWVIASMYDEDGTGWWENHRLALAIEAPAQAVPPAPATPGQAGGTTPPAPGTLGRCPNVSFQEATYWPRGAVSLFGSGAACSADGKLVQLSVRVELVTVHHADGRVVSAPPILDEPVGVSVPCGGVTVVRRSSDRVVAKPKQPGTVDILLELQATGERRVVDVQIGRRAHGTFTIETTPTAASEAWLCGRQGWDGLTLTARQPPLRGTTVELDVRAASPPAGARVILYVDETGSFFGALPDRHPWPRVGAAFPSHGTDVTLPVRWAILRDVNGPMLPTDLLGVAILTWPSGRRVPEVHLVSLPISEAAGNQ